MSSLLDAKRRWKLIWLRIPSERWEQFEKYARNLGVKTSSYVEFLLIYGKFDVNYDPFLESISLHNEHRWMARSYINKKIAIKREAKKKKNARKKPKTVIRKVRKVQRTRDEAANGGDNSTETAST